MQFIQHKFKKYHKVTVKEGSVDYKRLQLEYGFIGLASEKNYLIGYGEVESIRRTIKKILKKAGTVHIRPVLDRAITSKPSEVRMGKGKGSFKANVGVVNKGTILLELSGDTLQQTLAISALKVVQKKLAVPVRIVFYQN